MVVVQINQISVPVPDWFVAMGVPMGPLPFPALVLVLVMLIVHVQMFMFQSFVLMLQL